MAEMQAITLTPVPFYDDTLYVWQDPRSGKDYVAPRPMVEMFGLTWSSQHRKLTRRSPYKEGITRKVIPSDGGPQEALLLEQPLVHNWLITIPVSRVRPSLQAKLLRYQRECAQVLDDYFTHGIAVNPRYALPAPAEPPTAPAPSIDAAVLRVQVEMLERVVALKDELLAVQETLDEARQEHIADLRQLRVAGPRYGPPAPPGRPTTADITALAERLTAWLATAPAGPWTLAALRRGLGDPELPLATLRRAANRLVRTGALRRRERGVYARREGDDDA